MSRALVIGVGNLHRGDDAAGLLVIRQVDGARTVELGDCSDLLDIWEGEAEVVIVDAMVSGLEPGTVRQYDALAEPLPTRAFSSTHAFGLAEVIELARTLNRVPEKLTVFGIEAATFTPGQPPTTSVALAVEGLAADISGRLD